MQLLLAILLPFPGLEALAAVWTGGGGLASPSPSCPPPAVMWTDTSPRQGEGSSAFLSVPPSVFPVSASLLSWGQGGGVFFPRSL